MKTYSKIKDRSFFRGILTSMPQSTTPSGPACAKARRGTTLIEVVVAMLILAILAVMVPTALRHPRFLVVSATQKQAAILVANEALEEALAMDYNNLLDGTLASQYAMHNRPITVIRTVVDFPDSSNPEYKRVTVTVTYPGAQGDSVVLETYVAPQ